METKPQNRFRLAPKESPTPTFPVAGAIASNLFLAPVEGGVALESACEAAFDFPTSMVLGELKSAKLLTSGYDDPQLEVIPFEEPAEEPEAAAPPLQTEPRKLKFTPKAPPAARLESAIPAITPIASPPVTPRMVASTLRTKFVLGPNPNKKVEAPPPPPAPPMTAKAVAAAPVPSKPVPSAPIAAKSVPPKPATPVTPAAAAKPSAPNITIKVPPAPQKPAAAAAAAAPAPVAKQADPPKAEPPKAEPPKPAPARPAPAPAQPAAKVAEPPKPVAEPVKPVEAARPVEPPKPMMDKPAPEKPKINVRPTQPPPPPPVKRPQTPATPARPSMAARDHGNAVPVEREEPAAAAPPPQPKPKVQPIRPAATPTHDVPMIGLPDAELGGFWAKSSTPVKGAIIGVVVLIAIFGGSFLFKGGSPTPAQTATTSDAPTATAPLPGAVISGGGWSPNWGSEAPNNKGKQISIFRPTMSMADYSIMFNGMIEKKAIGWIFRAHDPKNYYVYKLKIVKPGVDPVVALEKFAVVNGKEDVHTQTMLNVKANLDTIWNIRTDVQGAKFTTYVQDKLADYMTDDRIKTGGAGFYNEAGEFAQIKNSAFHQLTYKK